MAGYRIYRVAKEGRFVGVHEVCAASDDEALDQARKLMDGLDLEVWRDNVKIGYLRSEGHSPETHNNDAAEGTSKESDLQRP